jgi:phage protein U
MIAGQLGDIVFEVLLSPEELEREQSWAYAEHEIAGGKNKLEATGEMLAHVKIRIRLHGLMGRWYCDPAEEADRFTQMARDQVYGDLFLGNRYLGQYAIGRISERQNRLAKDGTVMSIELALDLIEYN